MASRIKGITVTLVEKKKSGEDGFGHPVYTDTPVEVENVLVSPTSTTDIINENDLTGKTAVYTLAIPKGDTHTWENRKVIFFGESWKTFGKPIQGIESNIPLDWNKKVMVERYE
jgi:hypothetical protein